MSTVFCKGFGRAAAGERWMVGDHLVFALSETQREWLDKYMFKLKK